MSERKPDGVPFETWIERQLREATERGDFDNLPGAGKPLPGLDQPHDDAWWIKQKLERENLSWLPPSLALRREIEDALTATTRARSEPELRQRLSDINARILEAIKHPPSGPPHNLTPVDIEQRVQWWREQRANPDRA